jgi:hypothetical protein
MRPDVFYFHPTSKDVLPGRGRKEFVADPVKYADLAEVPDWRKALAAFQARPVTIDLADLSDEDSSSPSSTSSSTDDILQSWSRLKTRILESSAERVYAFHPEARRVLDMTGSAELWYGAPDRRPIRCHHLEKLRASK